MHSAWLPVLLLLATAVVHGQSDNATLEDSAAVARAAPASATPADQLTRAAANLVSNGWAQEGGVTTRAVEGVAQPYPSIRLTKPIPDVPSTPPMSVELAVDAAGTVLLLAESDVARRMALDDMAAPMHVPGARPGARISPQARDASEATLAQQAGTGTASRVAGVGNCALTTYTCRYYEKRTFNAGCINLRGNPFGYAWIVRFRTGQDKRFWVSSVWPTGRPGWVYSPAWWADYSGKVASCPACQDRTYTWLVCGL